MLMVGTPLVVTDTEFVTCNIAEDDATAWSGATAYVVGDRAMVAGTTHELYECILGHTNKPPTTAANIGVYWVLVSKTNRWKAFDQATLSLTRELTQQHISYRLNPQVILHGIAFFVFAGNRTIVTRLRTTGARVNYDDNSEGLNNFSYWTMTNVTSPAASIDSYQDPFDMWFADEYLEDATAAAKGTVGLTSRSYSTGSVYTISVYARRRTTGTARNVRVQFPASAFGASYYGNFTLSGAGTAAVVGATSAAIARVGTTDWYRCSVTATATATVAASTGTVWILDAALTTGYLGVITAGIVLYGFQNNSGALATYQVTRNGVWFDRTILDDTTWPEAITGTLSMLTQDRIVYSVGIISDQYELVFMKSPTHAFVQVGEIVPITESVRTLGELTDPVENSLIDFSVKSRDDFGNITLIQRNYADDTNYTFAALKAEWAIVRHIMRNRRATPLVFWESDDLQNLWGLLTYAFINGFTTTLGGGDTIFVSLDTEGMG